VTNEHTDRRVDRDEWTAVPRSVKNLYSTKICQINFFMDDTLSLSTSEGQSAFSAATQYD